MGLMVNKRLFGIFTRRAESANHEAVRSSPAKAVSEEMEAVVALDGIEKKYSADCDFTRVGNERLASYLAGALGSKALKYRPSGTLRWVHFSKQVVAIVAPVARSGACAMPFVVQKYVHESECKDVARFLLAAEFFDDSGTVLRPDRGGRTTIAGHAQILEIEAPIGTYSNCTVVAPSGATRVLLSLMTVDTNDEIVLLSDFALSGSLPAVPINSLAGPESTEALSALDVEQDCRAILPVMPDTEFAIQLSASSFDPNGVPAEPQPKALVAALEFFTDRAKRIPGRYAGTSRSQAFSNYVYVSSVGTADELCSKCFRAPRGAAWLRLTLVPWEKGMRVRLNAPMAYGALDSETVRAVLQRHHGSMDLLSAAERIAAERGQIVLRKEVLQTICRTPGAGEAFGRKLKAVSGTLRELDEAWVPDLPVSAATVPARASGGIRICHLHKVAYPYENSGGAIRNLNIVRSQKNEGMDPYVVLPLLYPFDENEQGFAIRVHDEVRYFEFKWPKKSCSLPLDRLLEYNTLLTYSVVKAVGADVIHAASGFRGYELALQGIALREKLGVPLIYEVRSFHEHTWGPISEESLTAEYTRLRMQKEDYCMRAADHVVTISESMRELLIERGVSGERIDVVPNGVDGDAFLRSKASGAMARERHDLNGHFVVGYISNMSRREGHDVLIKAVGELIDNDVSVKCLLVGDGPERQNLQKLAKALGIGDRVVFTGEIDHKEIHDYYRAMDLFVVPRRPDFASDYVTPLKPFEAMALGVPIVVSDRPALGEIVGDSERGMLFEAESVDSLVSVLKRSIANRDSRLKLADAAKTWIMRERTWKANCCKYAELYERVISDSTSNAMPAYPTGVREA